MNPGQLTRVTTASSGSLKEASKRALQLYRNVLKATPKVKTVFDVDMPLSEMRRAITWQFRKSAHIQDPRIVDMLVVKGEMDLEETLMQYKQKPHLMRILEDPRMLKERQVNNSLSSGESEFLKKFWTSDE
eukprot:g92.t1